MKTELIRLAVASMLVMVPMSVLSGEHSFDLKFGAGKISTVVENGLVRADRDLHHFSAKAGQRLTTAITSVEDNAVIVVFYRKDGQWAEIAGTRDSKAWFGKLPKSQSGKYRIEVGGTRGNTSYELFVGISVVDY